MGRSIGLLVNIHCPFEEGLGLGVFSLIVVYHRQVVEACSHLGTAVGKDFLTNGAIFARSPSGTGVQFSLFGLLGVTAGIEEGLELNLFGLVLGVDFKDPALKLPGIGRLGVK